MGSGRCGAGAAQRHAAGRGLLDLVCGGELALAMRMHRAALDFRALAGQPMGAMRPGDRTVEPQSISSISPGFQVFSKKASSGLYRRRIVNQPLPGTVWIQLLSLPLGAFGPK